MVRSVQERGAAIVLLGISRPGLILGTHPLYERVAASFEIPLETDALAEILSNGDLKADLIHPNAAGYRALAAAIHQLLMERGALRDP
jgi:acyl-CoA thioesterase-1